MLYVGMSQGIEIRKQLFARRNLTTADVTAQMLLGAARGGDTQYDDGYNFTGIIWYAPCYLYVVMDKPNCSFIDNKPVEDFDPIHFHESKPLLTGTGSMHFDENRAFYEGLILNSAQFGANAFRCINYFTSENGNTIRHPQLRTYGFEIRYRNTASLDTIDPDGQNQGPP
ncbi:MAG: hypothetical protein JO276_14795 [Sphingomonadaceae bacterium]|nr:hypothetical protein [Sphingomonadaceae bacterium]